MVLDVRLLLQHIDPSCLDCCKSKFNCWAAVLEHFTSLSFTSRKLFRTFYTYLQRNWVDFGNSDWFCCVHILSSRCFVLSNRKKRFPNGSCARQCRGAYQFYSIVVLCMFIYCILNEYYHIVQTRPNHLPNTKMIMSDDFLAWHSFVRSKQTRSQ